MWYGICVFIGFVIAIAICWDPYKKGYKDGEKYTMQQPIQIQTSTIRLIPIKAQVAFYPEDMVMRGIDEYIQKALRDKIADEVMEFVDIKISENLELRRIATAIVYVAERKE